MGLETPKYGLEGISNGGEHRERYFSKNYNNSTHQSSDDYYSKISREIDIKFDKFQEQVRNHNFHIERIKKLCSELEEKLVDNPIFIEASKYINGEVQVPKYRYLLDTDYQTMTREEISRLPHDKDGRPIIQDGYYKSDINWLKYSIPDLYHKYSYLEVSRFFDQISKLEAAIFSLDISVKIDKRSEEKRNPDSIEDIDSKILEEISTLESEITTLEAQLVRHMEIIQNDGNLENTEEDFSKYDKIEVEQDKKIESTKKRQELLAKLKQNYGSSKKEESVSNNDSTNTNSSNSFNPDSLLCPNFIIGLNKCNNTQEIVDYVDSIVDGFNNTNGGTTVLGFDVKTSGLDYVNGGLYSGFIKPNILITNSTQGYSYHIYDREYLYSFAIELRKLNLPEKENVLPLVMKFINSYFGFQKDTVDRRDDVLYEFAVQHAEEFYRNHNIPIKKEMGAIDQMTMYGDFPLSALKGTYSAQCVERSA